MSGDSKSTVEEPADQFSAETDAESNLSIRRRSVLAGTAGWASVTLAGCAGEEEPTEQPTEEPTDEPTEEPTPEPENYVVTDDVIAGSAGVPEGAGGFAQACSPQRQFIPGMQPVFDIGVWDPTTGDAVGPDTIDSATVEIDGGPTIELAWAEEDSYWGGSWPIPEDQEPGTYSYEVQVTNSGEYRNVGLLENEIEIIEWDDPRNYIVTDDLYSGSAGVPEDAQFVSACGPSRAFLPGMMVGFDIGVYDSTTGEPVGPTDFEYEGVVPGLESVTLTIEDRGIEKELAWSGGEGEHSELGEDLYWNNVWHIPEDAEPGTVSYSIDITNEDEDFIQVGVLSSEFQILEP